jgi:hypothetical protein
VNADLDVIALARGAGLCVADCHFLDLDPYEDLLVVLQEMATEDEREDYLKTVRREDRQRRERLHQLERFAAAVLKSAVDAARRDTQHWGGENFDLWAGAAKVCTRLEFVALELEERNTPLPEALV